MAANGQTGSMDSFEPTPAFLAARLALLALRATIDQSTALAADRVLLDAANAPMSTVEAAQLLAAKPKPLFCNAEASDDTLVVSCRTLAEADANESHWFQRKRRNDEDRGGFMGYLEERYGPADHLVAAFGRAESLVLPHSVADRWSREYEIRGASFAADDVDNPLAQSDAAYIDARARGAVGILRFGSSENMCSELIVQEIALPLDGIASESERREAEEHLVDIARMYRGILRSFAAADSAVDSTPPRSKWGEWQRKQVQVQRARVAETAEMLRQVFKGRTMPPDVGGFVEECDKYLAPP
jgi:hypothetical protein